MLVSVSLVVNSLVALSTAHALNHNQARHAHGHAHSEERSLPTQWYHREDHPVNMLFKRDAASTDGQTYPAVGTDAWSAQWQETLPSNDKLPSEWINALNAAVSAGKIPNIAPSTQPNGEGTNPVYAGGQDPAGPQICSQTYQCRSNTDVIFDAPDGYFASSFDDGPYAKQTPELVEFLSSQNLTTTHFMIGVNIFYNPTQFLQAFNAGHDIAVHTWNHPYMTTLSNEDVVAQIGYTMDIIHKSTGGRIPRYWRPPYGDADNRVNAIAKEVFHLTTIKWNQDTEDWSIGSAGGTTRDKAVSDMTGWLTGPKSPGLIILEHEVSDDTVAVFKTAFPLIAQNGWKFAPVTQLFADKTPYKNAAVGLTGSVANEDLLADVSSVAGGASPTSGSSSGSGSTASATAGGAGASGSTKATGASGGTSAGSSSSATSSGSGASSKPSAPSSATSSWTRSGLLSTTSITALVFALSLIVLS